MIPPNKQSQRTSIQQTPGRKKWEQLSGMLTLVYPLTDALLRDERQRLYHQQEDLVHRNFLRGGSANGYMHGGVGYKSYLSSYNNKLLGLKAIDPEHTDLLEEAEDLHQLNLKLEVDQAQLRQSLTVVLGRCKTTQDVRDVLPDNISNLLTALNTLPRQNEPGCLIKDNPILYNQYLKAVAVAYYYTANKLIF